MKKEKARKLILGRETLRNLEKGALAQVAGGASGWVTCGQTQWSWCGICKDTGNEDN